MRAVGALPIELSDAVLFTALLLMFTHFVIPLAYYCYLRNRWLRRPWGIRRDPGYRPRVTIIVPTYNEAGFIEFKLDDLARQDYPRELVEIIVVDSASTDGTPEKVVEWSKRNPYVKLILLREPVRRGMVPALNYALKHVSKDTEIVIFTDVDSFWDKDTLKTVVEYFADPSVGALTASIKPLDVEKAKREAIYRSFYNVVRIGESKIHSTPIHNGALVAYRKSLLDRIGGLPTYTGNNDSTPASLIAFMGYRAIQVDDVVVKEPISDKEVNRKIRRAQHLILHFIYTKRYAKKLNIYRGGTFDKIWFIECYLHLVNPWLLVTATILLLYQAVVGSITALSILLTGAALLALKHFEAWIATQLHLVIALIRNLWTREIVWVKHVKRLEKL